MFSLAESDRLTFKKLSKVFSNSNIYEGSGSEMPTRVGTTKLIPLLKMVLRLKL